MARTKKQERAKLERIDRAAEVLYYYAVPRERIALVAPEWSALTEEERERYRTLAYLASAALDTKNF